MTAVSLDIPGAPTIRRPRLPSALRRWWDWWRRWYRASTDHLALARFDERLLYDIGLDPLDLRNALDQRSPCILLDRESGSSSKLVLQASGHCETTLCPLTCALLSLLFSAKVQDLPTLGTLLFSARKCRQKIGGLH